jgi:hypothetical protein
MSTKRNGDFSLESFMGLVTDDNTEFDKGVLRHVTKDFLRNTLFYGLAGVLILFTAWVPLLWLALIFFGVVSIINFARAIFIFFSDILLFINGRRRGYVLRLLTTLLIFAEASIDTLIAYWAYSLLFV